MATTTAIYTGMKTALEAITGLRVYESVPAALNQLPSAIIIPEDFDPLVTMGGNVFKYTVRIVLFAGSVSTAQAFKTANNWLDPTGATSVLAAVNADATLGGAVDCAFIRSAGIVQREEFGSGDVVAAEFLLEYWRT
jgi:hypothetical protein